MGSWETVPCIKILDIWQGSENWWAFPRAEEVQLVFKNKTGFSLTLHVKIYFKWITNRNVKGETANLFKNNIGEYLQDLGVKENFLRPPKH